MNTSINDSLRHAERRRVFNVPEFKRLAAASINQGVEDVVDFQKLAEGGSNRTFLIVMRDGFQFVGRIPYPVTEPKHLLVASEVATMDFLRSHGLPVPEIYGYSTSAENGAGTEYIFMELIRGTNMGDVWFELPEKARIKAVTKLVELEARLMALRFPASGSLYYPADLPSDARQSSIPVLTSGFDNRFCIGPDMTPGLWYGNRLGIQVDRGPYLDPRALLSAGAKKEIAYLTKFGRPLYPFQRLRREAYNYQKQSHLEHISNLERCLKIVPYLKPNTKELARLTIRHPDLQPNNVFISDTLEITGLIDWQHCTILPLFLQCGIPNSLQNYGDSVSESLDLPELPPSFNEMEDEKQLEEVMRLRRRQAHYYYVVETAKINKAHYDALNSNFNTLKRKLFRHASDPWEGDSLTLKFDLINLSKAWPSLINNNDIDTNGNQDLPNALSFSEEEIKTCLRLNSEQIEADEQLQACTDIVGVGPEGWVPPNMFQEAQQRERRLKADALNEAESEEEREEILQHWIFSDFDEEEYL